MANDNEILNAGNGETEVWKPIPGYEGLYEVSSFGRIKSLARYVTRIDGIKFRLHEKIMSQFLSPEGYYAIVLTGHDSHPVRYGVHRLVALTFVDGHSEEKNHIDHIDGTKTNNYASNLRWVTRTENMHNPITEARIDAAIGRSVIRLAPDGSTKEYKQIKDVEADGFNRHKVCSCCTGSRTFHKGFVWAYKEAELHEYNYYLQRRKDNYTKGNMHRRKPIIGYNDSEKIEFGTQDEVLASGFGYNAILNRIKDGKMYRGFYWRYKK